MLSFRKKTNEPIPKKLTDRPYFIGPFWPRPGVQKRREKKKIEKKTAAGEKRLKLQE